MSNPLTRQEIYLGSFYALFQFLVLPQLALIAAQLTGLSVWILQVAVFAVNFLSCLLIYHRFFLNSFRTAMDAPLKTLGYALLGLLLYYVCTYLISTLILLLRPDYRNLNDASISTMVQQSRFWLTIGTVLFVPAAEEAIFRGLLFRAVYDRNSLAAWVLSASLFSIVHIAGYLGSYDGIQLLLAFLQYLPAGILFAFIYKKTDTIVTPVLTHTCINLIGMCLM